MFAAAAWLKVLSVGVMNFTGNLAGNLEISTFGYGLESCQKGQSAPS